MTPTSPTNPSPGSKPSVAKSAEAQSADAKSPAGSKPAHPPRNFLQKHSLSLTAAVIVLTLIVLYSRSNPATHLGSFFGNAIADWSGVLLTVLATKRLYEKGSRESKQPRGIVPSRVVEFLREHSLTLFLVLTGLCWVILFAHMNADSRWGQVVGNVVSEWTQVLGLVLMTKRLLEIGSKES